MGGKRIPLTEEQRADILRLLGEGRTQGSIARQIGCSQTAVYRIAKAADISSVEAAAKRAQAAQAAIGAQRDYNLANRLLLLNAAFEKAHAMLEQIDKPSALQPLVMSIAILIDKRRLEEGEVTNRTEHVTGHEARERVSSKLDQLAQRRARRPALAVPPQEPAAPEEAAHQEELTAPPEPEPQGSAA